jgi:hypothetical protein
MNPDIFAEWFRQRGMRVAQTSSSYWVEVERRAYQALPYHRLIRPNDEELTYLYHSQGAWVLRYSANPETMIGYPSYHAIYDQPYYGYETLGRWARKNVRHGLRFCSVEPISFQRLASEGYALQIDTLERQRRRVKLEPAVWQKLCLAAGELPGFQAWGALVDGELAASVISFQMGDWAYMLYQQSLRQYMPLHVNNALSFSVTSRLLTHPGIKSILYGLHSLDARPSMDQFKFRMGYTARPVRQCVEFNPLIRLFANQLTYLTLRGLRQLHLGNSNLSKAEGLLHFYLNGH